MHEIWLTTKEHLPQLGKHSWIIVVTIIIEAIGVYYLITTWEQATKMTISMLVAIVLGGVVVAQFFVYHDIRIERDAIRKERDSFQDIKNYEAAIDQLSALLGEGNNEILNWIPTTQVEYGSWITKWTDWGHRVEAHILANFGLSETNLFRNIVSFPNVKLITPLAPDHSKNVGILFAQLETIRRIIVRFSNRVHKWRAGNT